MEKLEYYTLKPNLKQFYGKRVDKNTVFEDKTEDGRVRQTFKNLTLTTKIHSNTKNEEFTITEDSTLKLKVPEGTILIWDEKEGWILPNYIMTTLEELKEEIEDIKKIYDGEIEESK